MKPTPGWTIEIIGCGLFDVATGYAFDLDGSNPRSPAEQEVDLHERFKNMGREQAKKVSEAVWNALVSQAAEDTKKKRMVS